MNRIDIEIHNIKGHVQIAFEQLQTAPRDSDLERQLANNLAYWQEQLRLAEQAKATGRSYTES